MRFLFEILYKTFIENFLQFTIQFYIKLKFTWISQSTRSCTNLNLLKIFFLFLLFFVFFVVFTTQVLFCLYLHKYNMNQVISTKKLTKKDTNSRQTSIQVALNFLETQKKTSSAPPLSIRQVALKYKVAEQTLRDAIAKGAPKCPGSPTLLTAKEENELVGYCLNMQSLGFGLTKEAVNTMVVQMLATKNKKNLTKNGPSNKWWK